MANFEEAQGFCKDCNRNVVKKRKGTNHVLHFLITVLTIGIWVVVWILLTIKFGGWYCSICGGKRV